MFSTKNKNREERGHSPSTKGRIVGPPSPKNKVLLSNYLPNPLSVLVFGTAPWRNSSLEFMRMSWLPATISTPSLIFLM